MEDYHRLLGSNILDLAYWICVIVDDGVAPVKILSKKEQKRLEDEEFERLMNEVGTAGSTDQAAASTQEESKQSSASAQPSDVDEKKRLAN